MLSINLRHASNWSWITSASLEFWMVADRFVGNCWLVAASLHIHALVVTEVFTTASLGTDLTSTEELPVGIITSFNTWGVGVWVEFVRTAWCSLVKVNLFVLSVSNTGQTTGDL